MPGTSQQYASAAAIRSGQVKPQPTAAQLAQAASMGLTRESAAQKASGQARYQVFAHGLGPPPGSATPTASRLDQNQTIADAASPVPAADSVDLSGVTTVGVNPITGQFGHLLDLTEM